MSLRGGARRAIPYLAAAAGGFGAAYLIVAFFVFPVSLASADLPVPNVTGLPFTDASTRLTKAGFKVSKGEQRYDNTAPEGTVLSQSPLPDAVESKGTRVVLDLSRGQRMVEVPRVVGTTLPQAQQIIQNAGLDVGVVTQQNDPAARGTVLASTPMGGARVPVPSPVALTVSAGPATVTIPDVVGQDYAAARTLLVQLGFVVGQVNVDTTSALPANSVISQTPGAGSMAAAGDTIALVIARRP